MIETRNCEVSVEMVRESLVSEPTVPSQPT